MNLSIILPTYNEKKSLPILIDEILQEVPKAEIIIVDDNSPDGTGKIADQLAKIKNINVIHRSKRMGLSSAVAAGFKIAHGDIIGVMDADLSHPATIIPRVLKQFKKSDVDFVIGSRRIPGGSVENWPLHRKVISYGATLMTRIFTNIRDPLSGLFFFRKHIIKNICFESKGYKICLELLVKATYNKIVEVPYIFKNREHGTSKLRCKEHMDFVIDMTKLAFHKIK